MEAAAKIVIGDWNGGKMRHYATPPGFDPSVMIDVDALREALMDEADDHNNTMLEEGEDYHQVESMKTE